MEQRIRITEGMKPQSKGDKPVISSNLRGVVIYNGEPTETGDNSDRGIAEESTD